jgi:C-terminal processing protease CtpA/Prc
MSKGLFYFKKKNLSNISHYFSDHGIFITNIIPGGIADKQGHLRIGDRLIQVQSMVG